ncbi:uncharacterized protein LOC143290257 [Babylonia areolata]|uniref:uncharacterized protein LOC143290257 n=1 Tax=Babylonia areolata TaxID=304850 RepID=UPI003FD51908
MLRFVLTMTTTTTMMMMMMMMWGQLSTGTALADNAANNNNNNNHDNPNPNTAAPQRQVHGRAPSDSSHALSDSSHALSAVTKLSSVVEVCQWLCQRQSPNFDYGCPPSCDGGALGAWSKRAAARGRRFDDFSFGFDDYLFMKLLGRDLGVLQRV